MVKAQVVQVHTHFSEWVLLPELPYEFTKLLSIDTLRVDHKQVEAVPLRDSNAARQWLGAQRAHIVLERPVPVAPSMLLDRLLSKHDFVDINDVITLHPQTAHFSYSCLHLFFLFRYLVVSQHFGPLDLLSGDAVFMV